MPSISIITTVYERTDVSLFEETIRSVKGQSQAPAEWLVLAHGPISRGLEECLSREFGGDHFRCLKLSENLGIQGGLRYCLENARGDYILSLDADDLLDEATISVLTEATVKSPNHKIFYSDEDLLIGGRPHHPFLRPSYDPIHIRMHSYIWHCVLFHRLTGLQIGAYTNSDAEYAQDWDTLLRFDANGMPAQLVPAVLYHWRQHSSSLSNSGKLFDGSIQSIKACLEFIRTKLASPNRYTIAPYPIARAGTDYYLQRDSKDLPKVSLVTFPHQPRHQNDELMAMYEPVRFGPVDRSDQGVRSLIQLLAHSDSPYTMIMNSSIFTEESIGYQQALKHFEVSADVVAVSGVIANRLGSVVSGCPVNIGNSFVDPIFGKSVVGYNQSMFNVWKAHCVDAISIDFSLIKTDFLKDALAKAPSRLPARALGWWIGQYASAKNALTVFEPMLVGFIDAEQDLIGDPAEQYAIFQKAFGSAELECGEKQRGAARLIAPPAFV